MCVCLLWVCGAKEYSDLLQGWFGAVVPIGAKVPAFYPPLLLHHQYKCQQSEKGS